MPTPLSQYQTRLKSGILHPDSAQLHAIRHLTTLHQTLLPAQPPTLLTRTRRLLQDWLPNKRNTTNESTSGIYLWGGVGSGKTMLMDLFYHALGKKHAKRIHFHRFMLSIHAQLADLKNTQDPLNTIAARIKTRCRVLCLDEFSVTDITDAMLLHTLLHQLFHRRVALVTTSNTPPQDLYKNGLQRQRFLPAIALLQRRTKIIRVDNGKDYRRQHLPQNALYHTPHTPAAERTLRQTFARLENQTKLPPLPNPQSKPPPTITIAGRPIPYIAAGTGTIWFTFPALCATHRSKVDYTEISKRYHTLLLTQIPRFTPADESAARRFIELIDEIYDRRVNLIATAAAAPNDLYHGTRLRTPFQRTTSRLLEMSSPAYLSQPHL